MHVVRHSVPPMWPADGWGFPGQAERRLRTLSHLSLIVFALAAVTAGVLAGISLSSEFGIGSSSSFIVVAVLFPLLCGGLAREVWRVKKLEEQIKGQEATLGFVGSTLNYADNSPAGLLIVSRDLRVQFVNQKYLETTLQDPAEVLGWKLLDIFEVEGLEEQTSALLDDPDPAASCCLNSFIQTVLSGERPVHITLTRIAPRRGEDRILVVVEELLSGSSFGVDQRVEGYVC